MKPLPTKATSVEPVAQTGVTPPNPRMRYLAMTTAEQGIVNMSNSSVKPVHQAEALPKKPGRPFKYARDEHGNVLKGVLLHPKKKSVTERIEATFAKTLQDAELLVAPPGYDGGGTPENLSAVTKDSLERRVTRRLNILDRYLTDERLLQLLERSSLKEVGVYEGIMLYKALVLKGQPTVIVGSEDRARMSEVLPRLLSELKSRKMITTVSERKLEFQDVSPNV